MDALHHAITGFLRFAAEPLLLLVWCFVLAVPLWLIRRYYPPAERWLYGPLYNVCHAIGKAAGRAIRRGRNLVS